MSFAWHEIRDHLMRTSFTLSFHGSFDSIRRSQKHIRPFREPSAILDTLHRQSGHSEQKNLILVALVRAAQGTGPAADCALSLMLLALWPGLDAIRRRSTWRRIGAPGEIASDILARTTEAIRGLDLQRVSRVAATVLRNVERDMIRVRQREADFQNLASDVDPDDVTGDHDGQDPALSYVRLQDDLQRLIGADATLVIRVAIGGFSQAEVAIELGLSEAAARKRYQRARQKLREAFHEIA